jgi:hypothetical protein
MYYRRIVKPTLESLNFELLGVCSPTGEGWYDGMGVGWKVLVYTLQGTWVAETYSFDPREQMRRLAALPDYCCPQEISDFFFK